VTFLSEKVKDFYPEKAKFDIPELIFIPTIFDYRNAASYQGVEFALRWYFHLTSSIQKCNFKIVLVGTEDKSSFFQNCDFSNFLKCPNVEYLQNSFEAINNYIKNYNIKEIEKKEVLEKIKLIGIKAPTSYKSHHSIANEWAILRWAKALNIETNDQSELKKIEDNIESDLYYEYLNTIHPIAKNDKFINKTLSNSGNVLFIDDEVEKGWDIIFKTICKNKTYNSFGKDFKNWPQMEIIEESFKKAKDADVVILDLRLHDDDFESTSPKELTGFKILDKIKSHNRGIQVIIFSATNKIWNLQALREAGADGFIIKESPENSVDKSFTNQSIENIFKTIDKSLEFSFLIDYYDVYNDLETSLKSKIKSKELDKDFVNEYLKWLSFGINNLTIYKNSEGIVTSFLMFFSVLENLCNRIIDIDNYERDYHNSENVFKFKFRHNNTYLIHFNCMNDDYTKTNNTLYSKNSRLNWGQKILNTLNFLSNYKIEDDLNGINKLIKKRNDLIHSNVTTGDKINISVNDVNNLFNLITTNIDKIK
jgi:CheY-like chemotaxis protein